MVAMTSKRPHLYGDGMLGTTAVGSMWDWTSGMGLVEFASAAWVWDPSEGQASLLVTESANSCDALSDLSDGIYTDAAFHIIIADWADYGPATMSVDSLGGGTMEAGDGEPDVTAAAYILWDGEGASLPLDGSGGTVTINEITLGGNLMGRVNVDGPDPAEGAEGDFDACYCEDLMGFSFPMGPLGDPDADGGPPPDGG